MSDYTNAMRPVVMLQVEQEKQRWMVICMRILGIDVDEPDAADKLRSELARRFPRLEAE